MTLAFSLSGIAKRYPHFALQDITLDLPEGNAMRAPGEASGLSALEVAMDELAQRLGIDDGDLGARIREAVFKLRSRPPGIERRHDGAGEVEE